MKLSNEKMMHPIGKRRIYKLVYRDGNKCAYCGCKVIINGHPAATVDHVIPKCEGGIDHIDNCVVSCEYCNNLKAGYNGK